MALTKTPPRSRLRIADTHPVDLLLALVERPQRVLNRDQLLDLPRGRAANGFDRSVDVLISRLRRKIEADPKEPAFIKTVRSGGYVFSATVTVGGKVS